MRKPSYLLAALLVCATPAVAQQATDVPAAPSSPAQSQPAPEQAQQAPSLFVSDAEIREGLREQDQKQEATENAAVRRAVPMQYVWLAGAIAVGIIVAAIVL